MNFKTLILTPVLLASALGTGTSVQAGFEEEARRIISGKYPYIAKIMRLQGEDPQKVHLVGKWFQDKQAKQVPAIVRINGQEVPSQRVNRHHITLVLPHGVSPEAGLTVTLGAKESMREVLGTPIVYASPDKALMAKPFTNLWEIKGISTQIGADGTPQRFKGQYTYSVRVHNYLLSEAFPEEWQAQAAISPEAGQAITAALTTALGHKEFMTDSPELIKDSTSTRTEIPAESGAAVAPEPGSAASAESSSAASSEPAK